MISLRAPEFWWKNPGAISTLLAPAGAIYGAVAARRIAQPGYRARLPVICVGNPTLGGAGKTPAAIAIGNLLIGMGKRPFFLTRGYGGKEAGPLLADLSKHSAREIGDEAPLLAAIAATVVSRDRAAGAKLAEERGADAIVMDDGFQNPSLDKDLSILIVDAARGIGNGKIFPAGPLRAPLDAQFKRAKALLVIGEGRPGDETAAAAKKSSLAVFRGALEPEATVAQSLKGKRVLAFAGIGNPEKFFRSLESLGANVVARRDFPDHYRYGMGEAGTLIDSAARSGLLLVTTEKDHARMAGDAEVSDLREQSLALPVRLALGDESGFRKLIESPLTTRR